MIFGAFKMKQSFVKIWMHIKFNIDKYEGRAIIHGNENGLYNIYSRFVGDRYYISFVPRHAITLIIFFLAITNVLTRELECTIILEKKGYIVRKKISMKTYTLTIS